MKKKPKKAKKKAAKKAVHKKAKKIAKKSKRITLKPRRVAGGKPRKMAKPSRVKLTGKKAAKREIDLQALGELIERGRSRGFVTDGEVLNYFPHVEEDVGFLEEI